MSEVLKLQTILRILNFKGGELVDDLLVVLQGIIKIIKNFFPAFLFTVIGLAYIGWDEKRDRLVGKVHENENQHNYIKKGPLRR